MASAHVFQSSRLTLGNLVFPDRLRLESDRCVFVKRAWVGGQEEVIRYEQIASVTLQRGLLFADLLFETTGGSEPVFVNGLWIRQAARAKAEIEAHLGRQRQAGEERLLQALQEQRDLLREILAELRRR